MSEENAEKPLAEEVKAVADKIAEAAPSVSPKDLQVGKDDALAGLKKVDQTILRLNKCVSHLGTRSIKLYIFTILTIPAQTPGVPRWARRLPLHIQLLALHPRIRPDKIPFRLFSCQQTPLPRPSRVR